MKRNILLAPLAGLTLTLVLGSVALQRTSQRGQVVTQHYDSDGPAYSSLTALIADAEVVVEVRVLTVGHAYPVEFDTAQPATAPAPAGGPGAKANAVPPTGPAAFASASAIPSPTAARRLLKTDSTVEVLDVLRGASARTGDQLVVTQYGGTDGQGTVATLEHDPVFTRSAHEILFLRRDPTSGKFFTTGGGQGRFQIDSTGTARVVDHDSPLGQMLRPLPATVLHTAIQREP